MVQGTCDKWLRWPGQQSPEGDSGQRVLCQDRTRFKVNLPGPDPGSQTEGSLQVAGWSRSCTQTSIPGWHCRVPGGTRAAQPGQESARAGLGVARAQARGSGHECGEKLVNSGEPEGTAGRVPAVAAGELLVRMALRASGCRPGMTLRVMAALRPSGLAWRDGPGRPAPLGARPQP